MADGEKSENQKKKEAKKAEKANKKAAHNKADGVKENADEKDEGPDVSTNM